LAVSFTQSSVQQPRGSSWPGIRRGRVIRSRTIEAASLANLKQQCLENLIQYWLDRVSGQDGRHARYLRTGARCPWELGEETAARHCKDEAISRPHGHASCSVSKQQPQSQAFDLKTVLGVPYTRADIARHRRLERLAPYAPWPYDLFTRHNSYKSGINPASHVHGWHGSASIRPLR